jgi:pepsin A
VYNIESEAFELAHNGDNNCTALIEGWESHDFWTLGQAWYQGKYLDHNAEGLMVGVAALKDKTGRGDA